MRIEITLGGALIQYLPKSDSGKNEGGNHFTFSHDTSLSLLSLLSELGISSEQRLLTILNGNVVQPDAFTTTILNDGDALSLMPPIVAG